MAATTILSRRQKEALSFKSNGLRDKQIAERMNISKSAVQVHLRAAGEKLNAHNTTQCVAIAVARKFISEPKQPHIADLEHQLFNLGLGQIALAYLQDRYNVRCSASLPAKATEDYAVFMKNLINRSM